MGKEKELQKSVEAMRGERETAERELARVQAQLEQMTSQTLTLEGRLGLTETQRAEHTAAMAERTNQIAALQKEAEQSQQRVSSLEEALEREKVCLRNFCML